MIFAIILGIMGSLLFLELFVRKFPWSRFAAWWQSHVTFGQSVIVILGLIALAITTGWSILGPPDLGAWAIVLGAIGFFTIIFID